MQYNVFYDLDLTYVHHFISKQLRVLVKPVIWEKNTSQIPCKTNKTLSFFLQNFKISRSKF